MRWVNQIVLKIKLWWLYRMKRFSCAQLVKAAFSNIPLTPEELARVAIECRYGTPYVDIIDRIEYERLSCSLLGILKENFPNLSEAEIEGLFDSARDDLKKGIHPKKILEEKIKPLLQSRLGNN